ncbi:GNAT family N-acetyltransferase [Reichenbachiella sp.]|uniref:GNAT family N-acetyltransferase n=1 Tax=Reichenbachiella sp. TaxID=2184521 RepID=UPI003B5C5ED3
MQLTTQRLQLCPITKDDSEWFYILNIDPQVRKYLWDDEVIPLSLSNDIINESIDCFKLKKWGLWKILTQDETIVGYCGLWNFFEEPQPQLLYVIDPNYHGNGYAREASQAIIKYAFETLQYDYLIASMDNLNSPSIHVCESLGLNEVESRTIEGNPTVFYKIENSIY